LGFCVISFRESKSSCVFSLGIIFYVGWGHQSRQDTWTKSITLDGVFKFLK
jgi:hypothetical protein